MGNPLRGEEVFHVYEFGVSGSTTLDNGITVAVHSQLGSSGGAAIFDEQHITLSGAFGALRIGRTESAAFNATIAAPGAGIGGMIGVNYSWFSTSPDVQRVNTYSGLGVEDAAKVVYTTPNFNGVTLGVSYAPEDSDDVFPGRGTDGRGEHTAVGVTYSTGFMDDGSLTLGAGFETASIGGGGDDASAMRAGLNISVDQISFGGSMYDLDGVGMQYDVGASWTEGATELGLQYGHNEATDAGSTFAHLTYTLGPGVLVGGQIGSSEDVTQVMLGTTVFF